MKSKTLKFMFTIVAAVMLLLFVSPVVLADTAPETTVDTGMVWGDGINGNFAHSTWYANGRHWVMYVQDAPDIDRNIVVSSTADYGTTWNTFTAVGNITTLFRGVAIWYCESTDILHYTYVDMGNATDNVVWYRAATPNANGTFTYLDAAAMPEGISVGGPVGTITIACDKNDLPFIAWTEDEESDGEYCVEVDASTTGNGIWTEDFDAWEEFEGLELPSYGHDYDTLYGAGNWTAVAVNLVPIEGAGSSMMHLSWSMEEMNGTHSAGIDATIYDSIANMWGNLTWVVPTHETDGLYPDVRGEIAFSAYNSGTSIHFVYCNWIGAILYQEKLGTESWDEISGIGNWTTIMPTGGYNYPAIAGYAPNGVGEDLIVVYHDGGSLYYDTKPYGPPGFSGTWTEIWGIPGGPDGDYMFLHSLQYRYGAGSPVGLAWDWGTLQWEPDGLMSGTLQYWFIDQDGVTDGENPLGWYDGGGAPNNWGLAGVIAGFLGIIVMIMVLMTLWKSDEKIEGLIYAAIVGLLAVAIIFALLNSFD